MTTWAIVMGAIVGSVILALFVWSFFQSEHSGLRIYGPLYLTRYVAENLRPKITQYTERPQDGRPFSLVVRSWVYRAAKGLSTKEGFGSTRDYHTPGVHTLIPAAFGITTEEMPDNAFHIPVGRDGRHFMVRYPVVRSAMSFGALGATATRALSDGTAILGEGALDNTGEGGLSIHHCPVNEEGERYRVALNERSKLFGRPYNFRFDKTATSDGRIIDVPLDLHRHHIGKDGKLMTKAKYFGLDSHDFELGNSERTRNLIIQIGPSMSGFKDQNGNLDWDWLEFVLGLDFVAGVEFKMHQGAKPNDGGSVAATKLTKEIAALRSIPLGRDYQSPERNPLIARSDLRTQVHQLISFFDSLHSMKVVQERGLITGLKMAYTGPEFATMLATYISEGRGPDYIQVDGAEGGTGASDTVMTDRVGFHSYHSISEMHRIMDENGVRDKVRIVGSGRLVEPGAAAMAMCLGADYVASARGPMLSLGCIQARECHSGHCPSGVATHHSWRLRGLDPTNKSVRYANYVLKYRASLTKLARAAGVDFTKGESFSTDNLWIVE